MYFYVVNNETVISLYGLENLSHCAWYDVLRPGFALETNKFN